MLVSINSKNSRGSPSWSHKNNKKWELRYEPRKGICGAQKITYWNLPGALTSCNTTIRFFRVDKCGNKLKAALKWLVPWRSWGPGWAVLQLINPLSPYYPVVASSPKETDIQSEKCQKLHKASPNQAPTCFLMCCKYWHPFVSYHVLLPFINWLLLSVLSQVNCNPLKWILLL